MSNGVQSLASPQGQRCVSKIPIALTPHTGSQGLPAHSEAGMAFHGAFFQMGGPPARPGKPFWAVEWSVCNETGPVAAVPGGCGWPCHPLGFTRALWSRDSGQHLCWCPRLLAENFLKKPPGWKLLEKCSVTRPVPAAHPRPNLEDASSYPFVF